MTDGEFHEALRELRDSTEELVRAVEGPEGWNSAAMADALKRRARVMPRLSQIQDPARALQARDALSDSYDRGAEVMVRLRERRQVEAQEWNRLRRLLGAIGLPEPAAVAEAVNCSG